MFEVLDTPPPVREPAHPVAAAAAAVRAARARAALPATRAQARWALDGVDLDLEPGRRVAVVGPSGAGKSTLAAVLLRFLPYASGSVTLDGVEIAELDGDEYPARGRTRRTGRPRLRQHARGEPAPGHGASHRARSCDAPLAAARLLDWTRGLPAGLQTEVGERGARMSGGQRQRLAIARALLADFPVLILDEPGEHLDTQTADAIVADLLAVTEGRTTLLITHRLTGLEDVDEVLVLDRGRVLERGTHGELIALGGRYAALWRARARRAASSSDYVRPAGPITPAGPTPARPSAAGHSS